MYNKLTPRSQQLGVMKYLQSPKSPSSMTYYIHRSIRIYLAAPVHSIINCRYLIHWCRRINSIQSSLCMHYTCINTIFLVSSSHVCIHILLVANTIVSIFICRRFCQTSFFAVGSDSHVVKKDR